MEKQDSGNVPMIAEIGLTLIDGEPRARDLDLADRLGFERPRKMIREIIERNLSEIEAFGICATVAQIHEGGRGRPATEYWLTEEQALQVLAGRTPTET